MKGVASLFDRVLDLLRGRVLDLSNASVPLVSPPVCIVGDIHGRLDLLELMLHRIAARAAGQDLPPRVVFVGDMIDRGPDSAGVLRRLHGLNTQSPDAVICLMGNHERMMLDFLDDPERCGPRWIAAGGVETLASFDLTPWGRTPMPDLARQLQAALTPAVENWIRCLPLWWQSGQIAAVHAGAAPDRDLAAQSPERMLWGARGRAEGLRKDGLCIVQGHDIVAQAGLQGGRIMVDTGAWRHGVLSGAWLDGAGLSIIQARLPEGAPD